MRVLRLTSVFTPPASALGQVRFDPVGGMQNHTGSLTRALDARGVRQDVVTAWRPGAPRVERVGRATTVHRLGVPATRGRQGWAAGAAAVGPRLARSCDVVHAHLGEDLAVLPIAVAAATTGGVPLVVTVHCSVAHTLPGRRWLKAVGGPIETWATRRADAVLVLTERLRAAAIAGGAAADRVHVVPSGVRPECFTGATPSSDAWAPLEPARSRVVFVGRLAEQKDPLTLVEAAARVRSDGARFLLVGDGPLRGAVEARIAALGLGDRVRVTGFLPHEEVPAVLRGADVMVLPSAYEELGSALLEAMRAGLPVVASRTGGIPEIVEDGVTGLLVAPGDAAGFAAAVDRMLGDPLRARAMGRAGSTRALEYGWDRLAPRVLDVYRRVCGRPLLRNLAQGRSTAPVARAATG